MTGIPMKSPSLKNLSIDPFVFALYNGIGVFVAGIPLIVYLMVINKFRFEPFGIVGASNIFIIAFLAFNAVQGLGYAIAPSIWAGVGMITAFILGAVAFQEHTDNIAGGICAVVILSAGIYSMSTLTTAQESSVPDDASAIDAIAQEALLSTKYSAICRGLIFCILNGLFDGAMMVPYKLAGTDRLIGALQYIASFSITSAFVSPVLFGIYCCVIGRVPDLYCSAAFLPGCLSGILWCLANFLSVHATFYLVSF